MSLESGLAAINLQMPDVIPRFEPSAAEYHWPLVRRVTGIDVNGDSPETERLKAARAFLEAWDYGIYFGALISHDELGDVRTNMGHAVYAERGQDFDDEIRCPFSTPEEVLQFDPWETYGESIHSDLVKRFNSHYRLQCERYPNTVNTTGIYISLMSGLISIFGWDLLLLAAGENIDRFGDLVDRYADWIKQYYDAVSESETTVIYSHDDIVWSNGPFMSPEWYRQHIFPNFEKLWDQPRSRDKKVMYVCDGDYTQFVDDIAACGNSGFWFEIFTDLEYVTRNYGKTHFIIGNGDARVLTFGTRKEIRTEVERCINLGKDCPGYFMCISGHIPPNVPVDNALYYNDAYQELARR